MPQTPHIERHFTAGATIRDIIIGMSDGLTVPFALAAGLSGAAASTAIIVTAGLAEISAGSIAMGLGGYLAANSDADHFFSERLREETEIVEKPADEKQEVKDVFMQYGMSAEQADPLVKALAQNPKAWVDFMMRFELGLEAPTRPRPDQCCYNRCLVHRWGIYSAVVVHPDSRHRNGADHLSSSDNDGAAHFQVHQGTLDWHDTDPKRAANRARRRIGGSNGLWHR